MSVVIPGLATSRKTPGVYMNVILGGGTSSAGAGTIKILLMGNPTAAISAAAPTISLPAATAAAATPTFIASEGDAGIYFGLGSEIHIMAKAVFAQYPDATVYGCSVAQGGGAAATLVCTFATTATSDFTIRLRMCGETVDVPVATGDTATVIATAVCNAVNPLTWLPYYAQFSVGAVTFTAKNNGPRGNSLTAILSFVNSAGTETQITTGSTTSSGATTGILSGGTQVDGNYFFSGGTTQDSFATALTAIEPTRYHRIVGACIDATNIGRIGTHITAQAAITIQHREQGIVACIGTSAATITIATGLNNARMQVAWHYNSLMPAPYIAAQVCAARVIGDSIATSVGAKAGEASDPGAPIVGMQLAGVTMQWAVADQPTATEIESALNNGMTVLVASADRPGYAAIARGITSLSLVSGLQNYAVLDTGYVTVCDYVADNEQSALATRYAGFKLGSNDANGEPPRAPLVTTPQRIRAGVSSDLKAIEALGIIRDVDANDALLVVEANVLVPGRVDMDIPVEPTPWLTIIAGNVRQIQSL